MATINTRFTTALVYAWCLMALAPTALTGQDALARAKDLYAAAEYAEALAALNKIENPSGGIEFDQYRALCLLALGRNDEASKVIQQIAEKDPSFEPAQVSPRVQSTFRDVRRRVLPALVRQTYADAKSAFDSGAADRAKSGFQKVIAQLDALDKLGSRESNDLRVLSNGFLDLIAQTAKAAAPPPPPPPAPTPATPSEPAVYTLGAVGVTPPIAISQAPPPWHPTRQDTMAYEGVLTILIDETGTATVVSITGRLKPNYEAQLRRAVSGWKFQPATKDRVPVKYRKTVAIRLAPIQEAPE